MVEKQKTLVIERYASLSRPVRENLEGVAMPVSRAKTDHIAECFVQCFRREYLANSCDLLYYNAISMLKVSERVVYRFISDKLSIICFFLRIFNCLVYRTSYSWQCVKNDIPIRVSLIVWNLPHFIPLSQDTWCKSDKADITWNLVIKIYLSRLKKKKKKNRVLKRYELGEEKRIIGRKSN